MPDPDSSTNSSTTSSISTPKVVTDIIELLFKDIESPESKVVYKADPRPTLSDINGDPGNNVSGSIETFELRTGPTDVDSYHDFFRLQLAFEEVWTELTADAGIYKFWNRLMDATLADERRADRVTKQFLTVEQNGDVFFSDGMSANLNINSISGAEDLENFLNFVRQQFGLQAGDTPPAYSGLASIVRDLANVTTDLFNQVNRVGTGDIFTGVLGGWDSGHTGLLNSGNWPDDALGTSGGNPDSPFANVSAASRGMSRYDYLNNTLINIQNLIDSLGPASPAKTSIENIKKLLDSLDRMLREKYRFDVFAPNSINYGLLLNYRQHWSPISYQVGNLVTTIPLAPQEVRKYSTKTVVKKSRNVKEMEDNLRAGKDELANTTRVDNEIVNRAKNNSNFQKNASGSFGNDNLYKVSAGMQQGQDQSIESAQTKRDFHEAVSKSAQEYRNEHKTEITTDESREDETTTYREIRNPNDELTVTYLFYELQRRYSVDEKLNKITPVILVANDVPSPHEVDEAWVLRHDWILKRVILDDSFIPALDYISDNYTGTEVELEVLKLAVEHQRGIVDKIAQQVSQGNESLNSATLGLRNAQAEQIASQKRQEQIAMAKSFFDPLGLTQTPQDGNADKARVDFAKDELDRAQSKVNQLLSVLKTETTALQQAIDKYVKAAKEHFNKLAEIDRLRIHVKDNILFYMQAIWTYEPPDQRYFRLYDIEVPTFTHNTTVNSESDQSVRAQIDRSFDLNNDIFTVRNFPIPSLDGSTLKLHQVADIENLFGFKGNYMIFPMVKFNYMNWFMMKDYLSFTVDPDLPERSRVEAKDPDPLADLTLSDLEAALSNIHAQDPQSFSDNEQQFREIMKRLLEDGNKEIIVPSDSLYIEALPGTHPLLEDFKLIHRAVDVKKAQAEARHAELENLRLASRLYNSQNEDPDIEKMIVISNDKDVTVQA